MGLGKGEQKQHLVVIAKKEIEMLSNVMSLKTSPIIVVNYMS